ncbi:hypothetical protein V8C86DRAFT_1696477 [Haematococcus lacustris]
MLDTWAFHNGADEPPSPSFENWQGTHAHVWWNWRLSDLLLPGSHNSGAFGLAPAQQQPSLACRLLATPPLRWVAAPWTLTQHADTAQQLNAGVRFLDVRVAVGQAAQPQSTPQLLVAHTLCCGPVQQVFEQVADWLDHHSLEVVVMRICLDWAHRDTWTAAASSSLLHLLHTAAARHIFPRCSQASPTTPAPTMGPGAAGKAQPLPTKAAGCRDSPSAAAAAAGPEHLGRGVQVQGKAQWVFDHQQQNQPNQQQQLQQEVKPVPLQQSINLQQSRLCLQLAGDTSTVQLPTYGEVVSKGRRLLVLAEFPLDLQPETVFMGLAHDPAKPPEQKALEQATAHPVVAQLEAGRRSMAPAKGGDWQEVAGRVWPPGCCSPFWANSPSAQGTLEGLLHQIRAAQQQLERQRGQQEQQEQCGGAQYKCDPGSDPDLRPMHFASFAITPNAFSILLETTLGALTGIGFGLRVDAPAIMEFLPELLANDLRGVFAITVDCAADDWQGVAAIVQANLRRCAKQA